LDEIKITSWRRGGRGRELRVITAAGAGVAGWRPRVGFASATIAGYAIGADRLKQ
jgi:hypothetical protein